MLKGKSVIELRNAKTGELEETIEDENLVTNALQNLANPPDFIKRAYGENSGFVEMPFIMTPLTTTCLQGLMLFDKNIVEDVNNIIPNAAELNQVGCASTSEANTMPYRGVLNATETLDLANGRRFVWDFATDRGNGTIRSVCLTSPAAGFYGSDIGMGPLDDNFYPSSIRRPLISGSDANVFKSSTSGYGESSWRAIVFGTGVFTYPIGSFEENIFLFLEPVLNGPTSYRFQKVHLDYSKLSLKSRGVTTRTEHTVTTNWAKLSQYPIADDYYIYSFFKKTTNSFDFVKINALSLEIEEERTVVVQDAVFIQDKLGLQGVVCDGYFYVCNGQNGNNYYSASGAYKINTEDPSDYVFIDFVAEGMVTNAGYFYIQMDNGVVSVTPHYHSGVAYIISGEVLKKSKRYTKNSSSSIYSTHDYILPSPWLKKPFLLATNFGSYSSVSTYPKNKMCFGFDSCYMATINNLTTPVVKNETQTMKVTYEITEV